MDGYEEIIVALVVSSCDGAEVFELVEEALDEIAVSIEERAEGAFAQGETDGQAVGIDDGVNLGGQAAARAAHATGSTGFFWALPAC